MSHPERRNEQATQLPPGTWDIEGISSSEPVRDTAHGEGWHFAIGPEGQTALDLFPAASVARLASAHVKIELHRIEPPTVHDGDLFFSAQHNDEQLQLGLSPATGAIFLQITPTRASEPPESPHLPSIDETSTVDHSDPQTSENDPSTPLSDDADIPSTALDTNITTPENETPQKEQAESPRLTVTGRLGRPPSFRETPNGTLIARLPVAVHEEDGTTTWHTVLAFRERAERLRAQALDTGALVTIVGYPHQREIKRRDGSSRIVEELFAAVIRTPKPDEPVT